MKWNPIFCATCDKLWQRFEMVLIPFGSKIQKVFKNVQNFDNSKTRNPNLFTWIWLNLDKRHLMLNRAYDFCLFSITLEANLQQREQAHARFCRMRCIKIIQPKVVNCRLLVIWYFCFFKCRHWTITKLTCSVGEMNHGFQMVAAFHCANNVET